MVQTIPAVPLASIPHRAGGGAEAYVRGIFQRARAAARAEPYPTYERRMHWLGSLLDVVSKNQQAIVDAISADFGTRSMHETLIAEIFPMITSITYMQRNLKSWMKPKARSAGLAFLPARVRVERQPLGVVGVIAAWNYPVVLSLGPLAAALAAGNRVLLKPSELTPKTSQLMKELLAGAFDEDVVSVALGGQEVGEAFCDLPLDHLLYTGSPRVGRLIMQAAAKNLTPVTLELGGKSPCIVHDSYPIDHAVSRIAMGKWVNSGQTCVAPDYVFVHESKRAEFVAALTAKLQHTYPSLADNADYSSIVSEPHWRRLRGYIDDAVARGAQHIEINPRGESLGSASRKVAPSLLLDVDDDMLVMQEEIFGPVLPILTYRTLDEAVRYVDDHPRPLALYYFDRDRSRVRYVMQQTVSGGACINETVQHFLVDDLPFGGVGPSGIGAYHGPEGFLTFSHSKAVFQQARWSPLSIIVPPYTPKIEKVMRLLIKLALARA